MASAAIPLIFPPVRVNREYFGDGAVRQSAPISPALHLGASRVLVVGVSGNPLGKGASQQVVDATEEYFEAEDALGRWLEERCVREPNAKSLTAELFTDWKQRTNSSARSGVFRICSSHVASRNGATAWVCGDFRGSASRTHLHPPTPPTPITDAHEKPSA